MNEQTASPSITCPACGKTSYHPEDVRQRYCVRCHWWTGDPMLAWQRPELFTVHGVEPPPEPAAE